MANILGAGLCFAFSGQLARIATLRFTLIFPAVLGITYIGAYAASRSWVDIILLLVFGALGWTMKHLKWPRAPMILGFVLGAIVEQNMFISIARYGMDWITRPIVLAIIVLAAIGFARPLLRELKDEGGVRDILKQAGAPRFVAGDWFYLGFGVLLSAMMVSALPWRPAAKTVPLIVGGIALICIVTSLLNLATRRGHAHGSESLVQEAETRVRRSIHMDVAADRGSMANRQIMSRAGVLLVWMVGFLGMMYVVGVIPSIFTFIVVFMRVENHEPWPVTLGLAAAVAGFVYLVFDYSLSYGWPESMLGGLWPILRTVPSV